MEPIRLKTVKVVSWDIDGTMYGLSPLMAAFKRDLLRRMFSRDWVRAWVDFFRLLRFKQTESSKSASENELFSETWKNRR